MTAILGVSGLHHDAAAALVVDGRIVGALQEERLSRVKNDASLPVRAMRALLADARMRPGDLDEIVFHESPYALLERVVVEGVRGFPGRFSAFRRGLESQLGDKLWVLDRLADALDVPRSKVGFARHHESHAASAFFTSGEERAAVLTVDAVGERTATAIWLGAGDDLRCLAEQPYPSSVGMFYAAMTAFCGFAVNEGEQKLMGLAAHGAPRLREVVARIVSVHSDGSFVLDPAYFGPDRDHDVGFSPRLEALLGPRRVPGTPLRLETDEGRRFADVAATTQALTEEAMLALARRAKAETNADALCLAGGVALNALANARLTEIFARVYVQPAAGDAGGALGAALLRSKPTTKRLLPSAALGLRADPAEAMAVARGLGLAAERVDDPAVFTAKAIARGELVAFVAGRGEWGPRALGQRSLLGPAGPGEVRSRIHRLVKEREPFRPFAPATRAEHADARFAGVHEPLARFMTGTARARDPRDPSLGAVVHVDGTARVQTVGDGAPALRSVLAALERENGDRVVLNTSLNAVGEPLCCTALDAVAFFAARPVDALVVEDVVVTRGRG